MGRKSGKGKTIRSDAGLARMIAQVAQAVGTDRCCGDGTHATTVVVSGTDGFVRAFSGGKLVLQMDPEVPLGPIQSPGR